MRLSILLAASMAIFISSTVAFQFPHLSLLSKRADITPGSPLYNCHEACGEVILISQTTDYCSNSTYTTDLSSCLDCALTYNIWQYYGDDVKSAAKTCSDDATPSASSAASGSSATATATAPDTDSATGSATTSTSSAVAETASTTASSTNTATGTAASASASTGAASSFGKNTVRSVLMGALAWAVLL